MSNSIINIENVNKWFGDFQVLKNINLEVKKKTEDCCLWPIWFWQINFDQMHK